MAKIANPYDGTIAHDVHPDVVERFISDAPRANYPENVNLAIEWNRDLARAGWRCLHTNGNVTVWEDPNRSKTTTVRMCEMPTVITAPIPNANAVDAEIDAAAERFYSGEHSRHADW